MLCAASPDLSRVCTRRAESSPQAQLLTSLRWCTRGDERREQKAAPLNSLVTPLTASFFVFPHIHISNPVETRLWLAETADTSPVVGLLPLLYYWLVFFFPFPSRNIRDKHNNFKAAKASRWRSQQGPAAKSWYGVSLTLIQSDTWVSPKPSHCVLQMYINISMHWHNMDPLFRMLMRTRCCVGAAAAF